MSFIVITVKLPREMLEELNTASRELGVTRSSIIRRAIQKYLSESLNKKVNKKVRVLGTYSYTCKSQSEIEKDILDRLQYLAEPASLSDIVYLLGLKGIAVTRDQVKNAVHNLKRKGYLKRVNGGYVLSSDKHYEEESKNLKGQRGGGER